MPNKKVSPAGYQYSQRVGDQLFVAGQVPLSSQSILVGKGDPSAQTRQCLQNLKELIAQNGFNLTDIRHVKIYVVGEQSNLNLSWQSMREWFGGVTPPATLLGVSCLGYTDQLVEIDATILKLRD